MIKVRHVGCAALMWTVLAAGAHAADQESAETVDADTTETADENAPQRFDIVEYLIEGNSVLPVKAIERAVFPYLGLGKSVDDVEEARKKLEQTYHDNGYATVFVDIPEQDVVGGSVRLRVTEGRVDKLKTQGTRFYAPSRIRAKLPALAPGGVPHLPTVQEEMNRLNRLGTARQVTPVFRAGRRPGAIDVDLKVKDESPLHAGLEFNNRYGANTNHRRMNAMLRYDNLWQREHSLTVNYQTVPAIEKDVDSEWRRLDAVEWLTSYGEVEVYSGTYLFRPETGNEMTALYAVRSRSNVAVVDQYSVIGRGTIWGLRHIVPLAPKAQTFHSLSFGVDYKDFEESLAVQGADSAQTPIKYIPFSFSHVAAMYRPKSSLQLTTGLNFSIRGLPNRRTYCGADEDQFECKRFQARQNYAYLKSDYQYTRKFAFSSTTAKMGWQLANQPLISNEQFSAGGVDSVRGYLESERMGDDGVTAGLEYHSRSFAPAKWKFLDDMHATAFSEGASLRVKKPLASQQDSFALVGAGVGIRATLWKRVNMDLDWAFALRDAAYTQAGDDRLHFRLAAEF